MLVLTFATWSAWQAPQAVSGWREGRATNPAWAPSRSAALGFPLWQVSHPAALWVELRNAGLTKYRSYGSPDGGGDPLHPSPVSGRGGSGGVNAFSFTGSVWQATHWSDAARAETAVQRKLTRATKSQGRNRTWKVI
jgi:hypothetical protein